MKSWYAVREAVGLGLGALRTYKLRSALTVLGVVMGVTSLTGMSSILAGLNRYVATMIESLGASTILIASERPGENLTPEERRRRRLLSQDEVREILARCPAVGALAPEEYLPAWNVKRGAEKARDVIAVGTTPAYEQVHDLTVEKGRFLSEVDLTRSAQVAVIGTGIAEALFPSLEPLGKEILIQGRPFRVIGQMGRKCKLLGLIDLDNRILVPLGSFQRRPPTFHCLLAFFKPVSRERVDEAMTQVREVLRNKRRLRFWQGDTFGMFPWDTLTDLYKKATAGIYAVMVVISSIGLVVGGVGVMNITLVSVTERTREIGVRKALGARRRDVLWQFLTEAMTLTGFGGLVGVAIGVAGTWVINRFSPFPAVVELTWVAAAFGSSVGVGLVFGLWPALKAARLDPVEALRHE